LQCADVFADALQRTRVLPSDRGFGMAWTERIVENETAHRPSGSPRNAFTVRSTKLEFTSATPV
jgi:hypothetical protein